MISFPWDAIVEGFGEDGFPIYDRTYTASELRKIYSSFFTNGILPDLDEELAVTVDEMIVTVGYGGCIINGTYGGQTEEEGRKVLNIEAGDPLPRIDTVVLRWNANIASREIEIYILKGIPSQYPQAPTLTRTRSIHELGIADILVPANAASLVQSNVTDTRLNSSRCGLASPFMEIDTTTFYLQIQSALRQGIEKLDDATNRAIIFADRLLERADGQPCACYKELEEVKRLLYRLLDSQDTKQYYFVGQTLFVPSEWGELSDDTLTLTNNARFDDKQLELS